MNPNFYAVIPANVRYSDLKPNAKLLYGEITALTKQEGYCFASNRYFANLYNVNKNTISSWISDLKNKGFVTVQIIKEGNEVIERRIGIIEKKDTPDHQILKDNITSYNNTTNNILIREQKFLNEISLQDFEINMQKEFFDYWKEPNKSKTKMRWELEKTWDLKARMQRWSKRQNQWNPKKQNSLKSKLNTFHKAKQMMDQINTK